MTELGRMRKNSNGFGTAPMEGNPTGRAPRRLGAPNGPDPKFRVNPDDRRRARRAQRAARRVTRGVKT